MIKKYYYRMEHIELLNKKCFVESNQYIDILAVREDHIINFEKLFYLSKQEKASYNRIKEWIKNNYPEYLM